MVDSGVLTKKDLQTVENLLYSDDPEMNRLGVIMLEAAYDKMNEVV